MQDDIPPLPQEFMALWLIKYGDKYTFYNENIKSMNQTLSSEFGSHLTSCEMPCLLWDMKMHYCVHNRP
jgi:hypothetical protein